MSDEADPYAVLGISADVDDTTIRAAYAAKIRALAPEDGRSLGSLAEAHLQLINAAYALLADPQSRAQYDASRAPPPIAPPLPVPPRPITPPQPPLISEVPRPTELRAPSLGGGLPMIAWVGATLAVIAMLIALAGRPPFKNAFANVVGAAAPQDSSTPAAGESVALKTLVEWKADANGDPHTYSVGGLSITLASHVGGQGQHPRPSITISDGSGPPFSIVGQEGLDSATARFGVGKIDPDGGENQVLFLSFSGGAHCCTTVILIERAANGWRSKDLGTWDGDALGAFPTDVDGDGVTDLIFPDQRFAYAFAAYADSLMPPRIFNVVNARAREVSSDPRYRALFEERLGETRTGCLSHSNGACAAYVAIAARLGQRDQAWNDMIQSYDRTTGWDFPTACARPIESGSCPDDEVIKFSSYPAALAWFLVDSGYPSWPSSLSPSDPQRSPSFDCTRVRGVNLSLVCATPALSSADRTLASRALSAGLGCKSE